MDHPRRNPFHVAWEEAIVTSGVDRRPPKDSRRLWITLIHAAVLDPDLVVEVEPMHYEMSGIQVHHAHRLAWVVALGLAVRLGGHRYMLEQVPQYVLDIAAERQPAA